MSASKPKALVLLSGGMDSAVALRHSMAEYDIVLALSFDYDSKHNAKELPMAAIQARDWGIPHEIVDITAISRHLNSALLKQGGEIPTGDYDESNMAQTVVPFRNGIMLSIAAGVAESHQAQALVIAAHSGDHSLYPDCRPEFTQAMSSAISAGTYDSIQVMAPFIHMTKAQIAARGQELGVDFAKTWSCYKGEDLHCGECGTCRERRQAFAEAGIPDPTLYR